MQVAIDLQSLVKTFGGLRAVDGVTLSVAKGAVYGLIGPNGAGKTTTFSILAGYLRPSAGSARVLGADPQDVGELQGRVGVLPQDALLPAAETVGEFLVHLGRLQGLSSESVTKNAREMLDSVGGADWWKLRCGKLSHGMAKRVGLAQALLGTPEVVLLDEPTAGLDPKVAYQVRQFVKGLVGKCTVVVSSHNLQELEEVCTDAAILDHGKLVSAGTMADLTATAEEVRFVLAPSPATMRPPAGTTDMLMELAVRAVPAVKSAAFDHAQMTLVVLFDRTKADAEGVIGAVLRVLLDGGARISGVGKGRKLEQRVMELT
jgi:ABC-type multidrug transport system ATPase subunit